MRSDYSDRSAEESTVVIKQKLNFLISFRFVWRKRHQKLLKHA